MGLGWVELTNKKHGSGHESIRFCFGSKNQVRVRYFLGWVGSDQKILTHFAPCPHRMVKMGGMVGLYSSSTLVAVGVVLSLILNAAMLL